MEGLDKFREAFKDFSDNYVIIGGTACDITMSGTEVRPRATHDIDMIIVVERMTPQYGERFWQFIREAGYRPEKSKAKEGESPKYEMYRFVDGNPGFPEMIELLSRHPDALGEPKGLTIGPLPIDGEQSSLSAIIMDDDYYQFTIEHRRCLEFIKQEVDKSKSRCKIVVTHHVPSYLMQCPKFADSHANGAFIVELKDFIEQSNIDFWIFGHSHYNIDKVIGKTTCLSNQLGYVFHNEHKSFDHGKYFIIE